MAARSPSAIDSLPRRNTSNADLELRRHASVPIDGGTRTLMCKVIASASFIARLRDHPPASANVMATSAPRMAKQCEVPTGRGFEADRTRQP
jgi:hypothetical protein